MLDNCRKFFLSNIVRLVCLFVVCSVLYCSVLCCIKVHGTLLKVPTVIAAMLEQHQSPTLELCESLENSITRL